MRRAALKSLTVKGRTRITTPRTPAFRLLLSAFCLLPACFCLPPSAAAADVWARQNSGTLAWLRGVHFLDARTGWAVGGRGVVLRTADGGETWKLMPRPTEDSLRDVHFTDSSNGWLVCDKDDFAPRNPGEPRSYLMRTTDAGLSWSRVRPTGAETDVRLVRVVFAGPSHGWVFGEAGALYATRDGGANWSRQPIPTRHLLLGGAFLDARHGWLVGAGSTFVQTADGGDTWRNAAVVSSASSEGEKVSARVNAVSFADARSGLAVGASGRVFATGDGGRTWRALRSGVEENLHDVKLFAGGEAWAAGERGTLLHSTDGGARWSRVPLATTLTLERLFFAGRERAWAVGFGGLILARTPAAAPRLKQVSSD